MFVLFYGRCPTTLDYAHQRVLPTYERNQPRAPLRSIQRRLSARLQAQPALFMLKEDYRPVAERTAAARYAEPTLLCWMRQNCAAT
jgi:hypothetical protein